MQFYIKAINQNILLRDYEIKTDLLFHAAFKCLRLSSTQVGDRDLGIKTTKPLPLGIFQSYWAKREKYMTYFISTILKVWTIYHGDSKKGRGAGHHMPCSGWKTVRELVPKDHRLSTGQREGEAFRAQH